MVSQTLSYIAIFCFCARSTFAQQHTGARFNAMADNFVAVSDVWNANGNAAGIASIRQPSVAISYSKYFKDSELSSQAFVGTLPLKSAAFGLGIHRYGITEYQQITIRTSAAKAFGNRLAIGLTGNYHQLKISNYGANRHLSFDFGMQYQLSEALALGGYFVNPARLNHGSTNSFSLPSALEIGLSYKESDKLLLVTTFKKALEETPHIAAGLEYELLNSLLVRGGIGSKPFKQYFGIGFSTSKLKIDVALENHTNLGYTPQLALSYVF